MNKMYNLVENMKNVGYNVGHNWRTYSLGLLMAGSSVACSRSKTTGTVLYDGNIGKDLVYARLTTTTHDRNKTSRCKIDRILEDGTELLYHDDNNDKILDRVSIKPADGEKVLLTDRRNPRFIAANKNYQHLRDTILDLSEAAREEENVRNANADSAFIDKYFK